MSIAGIQTRLSYGIRSDVGSNIHFLNEHNIIYPAGSNCIIYNIDQKTQRFLPCSPNSQGTSCLALSSNKRYLAVAEKGIEKGFITVFDLMTSKKVKSLLWKEMTSQTFVSLSFSPDCKYLAALTGKPDQYLLYWAWDKSKVLASLRISGQIQQQSETASKQKEARQVSFNPNESTQLCLTGDEIFRLLRYTEGALKQFAITRATLLDYMSHTWLTEDKVILGTSNGKLQLFEGAELKFEFNLKSQSLTDPYGNAQPATLATLNEQQSTQQTQTGPAVSSKACVHAILRYSKGFICSGGSGVLHLFEKSEDVKDNAYKKSREVYFNNLQPNLGGAVQQGSAGKPTSEASTTRTDSRLSTSTSYSEAAVSDLEVISLSISPNEENVIASTRGHQIYSLLLSTADMAAAKGDHPSFDLLIHSYHSDQITGMDVCLRKPILVTCALDQTLKIWNYESNVLELTKEFQEEAYSVAMHPSGLFLLVGFSEKLRLMNILYDDIRYFKEFGIRGCKECAFSHGGHLFAAVNNNLIQLYNTYSFENIQNLKGHNGNVKSLVFSQDDQRLVSCSKDGAIYEWCILTGQREGETVHRQCIYTSLALTPDARTSYVVGSDGTLKELILMDSMEVRRLPAGDVILTQVVLSHSGRMLFCGTSHGTIRALKFPLSEPGQFSETQAHHGPVTRMRITYDDQYLVSSGEDACIFIYKITDKEGRGLKLESEISHAGEILITKSDLDEKQQLMEELKSRVEELKMENEYQVKFKDMSYQDKIRDLSNNFLRDLENMRLTVDKLTKENEQLKQEHEETQQSIKEFHSREIQEIESTNNQKLMAEYGKCQELQARRQMLQDEKDQKVSELESQRERDLESNTAHFQGKLEERNRMLEKVQDELIQQQKQHEEMQHQLEDDADREILDLRNNYAQQLRQEKEKSETLRGERGVLEKKCESQEKKMKEKEEVEEQLRNETLKQDRVIKSLENDKSGLKKEIQERDDTIHDKEKRIYDLKKKNQELEKFKFVLEYKIKELKKQIEPREQEIKEKKEQIHQMESELEEKSQSCKLLEHDLTERNLKLKATSKELLSVLQRSKGLSDLTRRFQVDLHNTVGLIQEPAQLKASIVALYKQYYNLDDPVISGTQGGQGRSDVDANEEYARQREHLERNVTALKKKLKKESEIHKADNVRIMEENVTLIREINDLRKELKISRSAVHDLETALTISKHQSSNGATISKTIPKTGLGKSETIDPSSIIDLQTREIQKLRSELQDLRNTTKIGKLPPVSEQAIVTS